MEELTRCPFVIDMPEGSINAFLPPNYAQKIETDPLAEEEFKERITNFIKSNDRALNVLVNDDGTLEEIQNAEQTEPDHDQPEQQSSDELDSAAPFKWTPELIKLLIDEVHQRENSKVPKKKMFQEITAKLNKEKNLALTEIQVTNRYKTLLRGYKNVIDNNKKTGTARKHYLFEKELGEITKGNPNIKPKHILSSAAGPSASSSSDDTLPKVTDPPKCFKEQRKRPKSELTDFLREESEKQDQRFKLFMDQMDKMQEKKLELFREIFGSKKD